MAQSSPLSVPWQFNLTQGNLIIRVDYDTNSNAIYQGWAQPGTLASDSTWRLVKNTYDASSRLTTNGFPGDANGSPSCAFSFIWNNRTTYTYT